MPATLSARDSECHAITPPLATAGGAFLLSHDVYLCAAARSSTMVPSALRNRLSGHPVVQQVAAERMPDRLLHHLPRPLAIDLRVVWVGLAWVHRSR